MQFSTLLSNHGLDPSKVLVLRHLWASLKIVVNLLRQLQGSEWQFLNSKSC
jgi:hypothetical protein